MPCAARATINASPYGAQDRASKRARASLGQRTDGACRATRLGTGSASGSTLLASMLIGHPDMPVALAVPGRTRVLTPAPTGSIDVTITTAMVCVWQQAHRGPIMPQSTPGWWRPVRRPAPHGSSRRNRRSGTRYCSAQTQPVGQLGIDRGRSVRASPARRDPSRAKPGSRFGRNPVPTCTVAQATARPDAERGAAARPPGDPSRASRIRHGTPGGQRAATWL